MTNRFSISYQDDPLIEGENAIVAYARRKNGNRPAKKYLEDLQKEDQAKLAKLFSKIVEVGKIINTERFRHLSGKIWEFKVHTGVRILCFQEGKTWFLTHGFNKQRRKTPPKEIATAEQIMDEHLAYNQR